VRRSDLLSLDPTFKRSSPRKFARAVLSLNFARDRALRTPHHLHPSDHTFISHPSTIHLNSISPPPISIKMSSFRVAAPKMASMAAQSSVKVARPAFQAAQLQKFTRAYSAVPKNTAFNAIKRTQITKASPIAQQAKRAYSSEMANALVRSPRTSVWVPLPSVLPVPVSVSVSFSPPSSTLSPATPLSVASSSLTPFSVSPSSRPSVFSTSWLP
jgi:hypothetical protein